MTRFFAATVLFLLSNFGVLAQQGEIEYGEPIYRELIRATEQTGEFILSLKNADEVAEAMLRIEAMSRKILEQSCQLEAKGIPISSAQMHPNDYALFGGDEEPGVMARAHVHLLQIELDLANQVIGFLEEDCADNL